MRKLLSLSLCRDNYFIRKELHLLFTRVKETFNKVSIELWMLAMQGIQSRTLINRIVVGIFQFDVSTENVGKNERTQGHETKHEIPRSLVELSWQRRLKAEHEELLE